MDLDEAPDRTLGCGLFNDRVSVCTDSPVSNPHRSLLRRLHPGVPKTVEEKESSFCHLGPRIKYFYL